MSDFASRFAHNSDVFDAYVKCVEYSLEYGVTLHEPMFVMVGCESAGKTTFICVVTGEPLGARMRARVGTLCPVMYSLKRANRAACFIRAGEAPEVEVKMDGLFSEIEKYMDSLNGKFSRQPLLVRIEAPRTPNMCLVDLPGYKSREDVNNSTIRDMIHEFCAKPNVVPIILAQSNHSAEKMKDQLEEVRQFLAPSRLRQDELLAKSLKFATQFDKEYRNFTTLKELGDYLEDVKHLNLRFFSCRPERGGSDQLLNLDTMSYEERREYFRGVLDAESRATEDFVQRLERESPDTEQLSAAARSRLTLRSAIDDLQKKWALEFSHGLPRISKTLLREHQSLKRQIDVVHSSLSNEFVAGIRAELLQFVDAYVNRMIALWTGEMMPTSYAVPSVRSGVPFHQQPRRVLQVTHKDMSAVDRTYEGEMQLAREAGLAQLLNEWPAHMHEKELADALGDNPLRKDLTRELRGNAALRRMLKMWEFQFMACPTTIHTADSLFNLAGYGGKQSNQADKVDIIRKMVSHDIHSACNISTFTDVAFVVFRSYSDVVSDQLKESAEFPSLEMFPSLSKIIYSEVRAKYEELLDNRMTDVCRNTRVKLDEVAAFFHPNVINQLMMLHVVSAINTGIPINADGPRSSVAPEHQVIVDDTSCGGASASAPFLDSAQPTPARASLNPVEDEDTPEPPRTGVLGKLKGLFNDVKSKMKSVAERQSHGRAMEYICQQLLGVMVSAKKEGVVTVGDFLNAPSLNMGQVSHVHLADGRVVQRINTEASMFCTFTKGLMTMEIEKVVEERLLNIFKEDLSTGVRQQLQKHIASFTDADLLSMSGVNVEDLQSKLGLYESRNVKVGEALEALRHVTTKFAEIIPSTRSRINQAVVDESECAPYDPEDE